MSNQHPMIVFDRVIRQVCPAFCVTDLSLQVHRGQTLAIFGPSGCGKTTTLRMIAGFERPDSGTIQINGRLVCAPGKWIPPHQRGVGMVFQDLALWPHMKVCKHLQFALKGGSKARAKQKAGIAAALEQVALETKADAYPHQLSGGEKQRLALARALIVEPSVLLMDEPLSSLDANLRSVLLHEIRNRIKTTQTTSVYVTHDWHEALFLADRIAMMRNGRIEKVMTPQEAYAAEEKAVSLQPRRQDGPLSVAAPETIYQTCNKAELQAEPKKRKGLG
jgi:iron(III) transport system ATP-binding protein